MGEYADMVISDSIEDYIRGSDYGYRRHNPCVFEDCGGELFYVNTETGEIIMRNVTVGREIGTVKCRSCGGRLVIRRNKNDSRIFAGCSGFPQCRQTYCL